MMTRSEREAIARDALSRVTGLIQHQDDYRASLPARYRQATLADLSEPRRAALHSWLDDPAAPWAVVLTGPPGRGKTFAGAAIGWERAREYRPALFASWPAWIEATKAAMDGHRDPPKLATFEGLLCLDDVGAGRMTDYAANLLGIIVSDREANMFQTVFTTNASLSDFGNIDGRLGSRLSAAKWLTFAGDDLRPTARPPAPVTIPPMPETTDEIAAEAERQGIEGFPAATFAGETIEHPEGWWIHGADWRRFLAPWHRCFRQLLAEREGTTAPGILAKQRSEPEPDREEF